MLLVIAFKIVIYNTKKLKNKAVLNLKQYGMCCYVTPNNVFLLMRMKMCIHYSIKDSLASYKACLCLLLLRIYELELYGMVV